MKLFSNNKAILSTVYYGLLFCLFQISTNQFLIVDVLKIILSFIFLVCLFVYLVGFSEDFVFYSALLPLKELPFNLKIMSIVFYPILYLRFRNNVIRAFTKSEIPLTCSFIKENSYLTMLKFKSKKDKELFLNYLYNDLEITEEIAKFVSKTKTSRYEKSMNNVKIDILKQGIIFVLNRIQEKAKKENKNIEYSLHNISGKSNVFSSEFRTIYKLYYSLSSLEASELIIYCFYKNIDSSEYKLADRIQEIFIDKKNYVGFKSTNDFFNS